MWKAQHHSVGNSCEKHCWNSYPCTQLLGKTAFAGFNLSVNVAFRGVQWLSICDVNDRGCGLSGCAWLRYTVALEGFGNSHLIHLSARIMVVHCLLTLIRLPPPHCSHSRTLLCFLQWVLRAVSMPLGIPGMFLVPGPSTHSMAYQDEVTRCLWRVRHAPLRYSTEGSHRLHKYSLVVWWEMWKPLVGICWRNWRVSKLAVKWEQQHGWSLAVAGLCAVVHQDWSQCRAV